jgi:hypothetical protein
MQMMTSISRGQLKAAIALSGANRAVLAEEAGICLGTLRGWLNGGKSGEPFSANTRNLGRLIASLEMRGIRFSENGVTLQRARGEPTVAMAATA